MWSIESIDYVSNTYLENVYRTKQVDNLPDSSGLSPGGTIHKQRFFFTDGQTLMNWKHGQLNTQSRLLKQCLDVV